MLTAYIRAMFHRPLSLAELIAASAGHLARPPVDERWHRVLSSHSLRLQEWSGYPPINVLRSQYCADLERISLEPSWEKQRQELIRCVLRGLRWRSFFQATQICPREEVWFPCVAHIDYFAKNPQADYPPLLAILFLGAEIDIAGFTDLLRKYFAASEEKALEFIYFEKLVFEASKLECAYHIPSTDLAGGEPSPELIAHHELLKATEIQPLIEHWRELVNIAQNQIMTNTLDLTFFQAQANDFTTARDRLLAHVQWAIDDS